MSNIKAKVKNYQIIKKAEAEFIPGLNIIIGPSNNGKSSFIKAIKSLLYTEPGITPIKSGESAYDVVLEINNHKIKLHKGMKDSYYELDDTKFSKYGTSTPEEVSKALGIKELILNGNKEQLNFWNQLNYPFLLDRSSTELFKFIIDSGDSDKVSLALKDMVKDRQSIENNIKDCQANIILIDKQIEDLKQQTKDSKNILTNCNKIIELKTKVSRLNKLKEIQTKLIKYNEYIEIKLSQNINIKNEINKILPKLKEIIKIYNELIKLKSNKLNIDNIQSKLKELNISQNKISKLPNKLNINTVNYEKLMSKYIVIKRIQLKLENIKLINIPEINWSFVNIDRINKLKDYKEQIIANKELIEIKNNKIKTIEQEQLDIKNILNHIEICPTCGHKIERGALI